MSPTKSLLICLATALGALAIAPATVTAEPPPQLPIQGYLADAEGAPVDGAVQASFTLYNAATGGDVLFAEDLTVDVDQGTFTVYLGSTSDLDLALFRDTTDVFLGVTVEGDEEMAPRVRMATAPFAAYARYAADAATLEGKSAADFVEAGTIDWADLNNVPADVADGDTTLSEAEVDAYVANNGYAEASALAAIATSGSWLDLVGIPADLADGDADTTYSAGAGLALSGTTFSADAAHFDAGYVNEAQANAVSTAMVQGGAITDPKINDVSWGKLTGVPAGLADGDDGTHTVKTFGGYIISSAGDNAWYFAAPTTTLTVDGSEQAVMSASGSVLSAPYVVYSLCYRTAGTTGTPTLLAANVDDTDEGPSMRYRTVATQAVVTLPAGTYEVGFCLYSAGQVFGGPGPSGVQGHILVIR